MQRRVVQWRLVQRRVVQWRLVQRRLVQWRLVQRRVVQWRGVLCAGRAARRSGAGAWHQHGPLLGGDGGGVALGGGGRSAGRVLEVEAHGQDKVELGGRALVRPLEGVVHLDVDLRPVEGAVARVESPALPRLCGELVEGLLHELFGLDPRLGVAERVLGLGRQLEGEGHAEVLVDGRDHV